MINYFSRENYPQNQTEAEEKAKELGFQSLLCITESEIFMGRSKSGIWCVGVPKDYKRIALNIKFKE